MDYMIRAMKPEEATAISEWHYPEPYSFYDMVADPEDLKAFLDFDHSERNLKYVMTTDEGDVIGFFEFHSEGDVLDIGLGMHPDATGKGLGVAFVRSGLEFAKKQFAAKQFRLAVASFNQRAIKVYERVGFRRTNVFMNRTNGGVYEFIEMVLEILSM